jgi:hypothetical protein
MEVIYTDYLNKASLFVSDTSSACKPALLALNRINLIVQVTVSNSNPCPKVANDKVIEVAMDSS